MLYIFLGFMDVMPPRAMNRDPLSINRDFGTALVCRTLCVCQSLVHRCPPNTDQPKERLVGIHETKVKLLHEL